MAIHDSAHLENVLQIPRPESHFQVGDYQLKAIRVLSKFLMQRLESQTGMHYPPPPPHIPANEEEL